MKKTIDFKQTGKTAGILIAGLLLGWLFFGGSSVDQAADIDQHISENHTDEQGNIVYTCSMHPSVRESEPGNCPICGMELIPVKNASAMEEENPYELQMTEAAARLAQIQTTEVTRDVAVNNIRMPGKVMVDERRIRSLPAHYPGRIEQLHVNFTGEYIEKGQKVASVYSPALISAQKELLEAKKNKEQNPSLYRAARTKLANWKIPESQINEIETSGEVKTQFDITSHMGGHVINRNIAVGDHVEMGTVMYQMADLSTVWIVFSAYESDLASLDVGDQVSFTVDSYPGESFEAEITYIDPILDPQSRTAKVRAEAQNPAGKLKPQMLAEGIISSEVSAGTKQVLIPKSAVLWTGERSVVYIQKPNTDRPTFEFREVVLGQRVGDQYIIKSGVQPGEKVVTNGNFKIDSAAQLAGKASMMNRNPDGSLPAGHDHGTTEMGTLQLDTNTGNHQHTEHLATLIDSYLQVKNALASDEFKKAKIHLATFKTEVTQSAEMNQHPEHSAKHEKHHAAMLKAVESASSTENLKELRASFVKISDNLVKALQNQEYNGQELYLQYCPMAQDKEGAYWISENEQIINPYMGQKMPECGETKKEIKPK